MNTIHQKFEHVVNQYPNNIAFSYKNLNITYKELNNKANNLANYLQSFTDKLIVVYSDQGINHIATLLAISKIGKTAIPLNSTMPVLSIDEIMEQYGATLVITDNNHYFNLKKHVKFNIINPKFDYTPCDNLDLTIDSKSEYIIFNTSGSTGVPKGVIHSNENVVYFVKTYSDAYNISANDITTLVYPSGFYGGLRDTFVPLLNGATLCYYDKTTNLQNWVNKNKITIFTSTVKMFRDLIHNINSTSELKTVRIFRPGGDVSYLTDFEKFKKYFPDKCKYMILFASSETGAVCKQVLTKNSVIIDEHIPLGYPIKDTNIFLIDEEGNKIEKDNEKGIIVIEHKYLFKGYKNLPDVTKKVLKLNSNNILQYTSNDYGIIKDKCLHFIGRESHHIKINGARIDINNITSRALHLVNNAVCIYHQKNKNLYLFYESDTNLTESNIKTYLLKYLPFYMVPARCILLSKIPSTENEKVNYNELLDLINLDSQQQHTKITNLQKTLINIWSRNLEIENVSIDDNYFDVLGGDSITAASIVLDIEDELTITLNDHVLYEYSTVRLLSIAIEKNALKYFKWTKKIINEKKKDKTPIFWLTGWPNILKKHIKYNGNMYYVDSHYNHFTNIPNIKSTIENYCEHICKEIENTTNSKHIILGGYSLGSVFAIEIAKMLQHKGKIIDTLFLLDPKDKIILKDNTISVNSNIKNFILNTILYQIGNIPIYGRYYIYSILWKLKSYFNLKSFNRRKYIHAIYSWHKRKYVFSSYSGNVIMIQRHNNISNTKFKWKQLFNKEKLIDYYLNFDNHSDFFENEKCIKSWTHIFNKHMNTSKNKKK